MEITKKSEGMFANQNTTASQTLKLRQTPIGWKTVIINNADKVRQYTISKEVRLLSRPLNREKSGSRKVER